MTAKRSPVNATGSMSRQAILNSVNVDAHIRATDNNAASITSGAGARSDVSSCNAESVTSLPTPPNSALRSLLDVDKQHRTVANSLATEYLGEASNQSKIKELNRRRRAFIMRPRIETLARVNWGPRGSAQLY